MKHQNNFRSKKALGISFLLAAIVFAFSYDFGMFWDNVLFGSKMGNHLYNHSIFDWTMPDEFDPGHTPFLGFLLAIFWKIFGHSLWVSHLLMFPFVAGIIYQLQKFLAFYFNNSKLIYFGLILVLADPTLSTTFVLVNPETIIIFFFFLAVNGILYRERYWKFIGFLFLSIITFRSMMLFAGLFLFDILRSLFIDRKPIKEIINLNRVLFYFFVSLPGFIFITWRLITKGWLQTHPNSPWADYWHLPSLGEFSKNIILLIHRYADFGRVFIFIFLTVSLIFLRKKITKRKDDQELMLLGVSSIIFVILAVLFSTNAFGHRYFIVSYICFTVLTFKLILEVQHHSKTIYSLLFIGLITGNLWIYPEKISQGWDATLAHTPYHQLRKEAIQSLESQNIDINEVASFFPNYNPLDEIDFGGNTTSFAKFSDNKKYIFYSNVYNLTDEEYKTLENDYIEIERFQRFNIYVSIRKLKNLDLK